MVKKKIRHVLENIEDMLIGIFSLYCNIAASPFYLFGGIVLVNIIGFIVYWDGWCAYFSFDFLNATGWEIVHWYGDMIMILFPQVFFSVTIWITYLVFGEHLWDGEL